MSSKKPPKKTDDPNVVIRYIQECLSREGHNVTFDQVEKLYASYISKIKSDILKTNPQMAMLFTLDHFSTEILQIIAASLSYRDIVALCLASKVFNNQICNDPSFWKGLVTRNFVSYLPFNSDTDYKSLYGKLSQAQEKLLNYEKVPTDIISNLCLLIQYNCEIAIDKLPDKIFDLSHSKPNKKINGDDCAKILRCLAKAKISFFDNIDDFLGFIGNTSNSQYTHVALLEYAKYGNTDTLIHMTVKMRDRELPYFTFGKLDIEVDDLLSYWCKFSTNMIWYNMLKEIAKDKQEGEGETFIEGYFDTLQCQYAFACGNFEGSSAINNEWGREAPVDTLPIYIRYGDIDRYELADKEDDDFGEIYEDQYVDAITGINQLFPVLSLILSRNYRFFVDDLMTRYVTGIDSGKYVISSIFYYVCAYGNLDVARYIVEKYVDRLDKRQIEKTLHKNDLVTRIRHDFLVSQLGIKPKKKLVPESQQWSISDLASYELSDILQIETPFIFILVLRDIPSLERFMDEEDVIKVKKGKTSRPISTGERQDIIRWMFSTKSTIPPQVDAAMLRYIQKRFPDLSLKNEIQVRL